MDEQDYCDWCYSVLTDEARARSRALGLAIELSWACTACLETGRYRRPPEGWDGTDHEWPARNVFAFSDDELRAVGNALNEVLHGPNAIPHWEFSTRIGVQTTDVEAVLRRIRGEQ